MRVRTSGPRRRWSFRRPSGCPRLLCVGPLPLDAFLAAIAFIEGVFHLVHLADEVGDLHEFRRRVAAGDDDMLEAGTVFQDLYHFARVDPSELHRVGELIEEEHVVGLVGEAPLDLLPAFAGLIRALHEVFRGPGPAVAHLEPVDVAELQRCLVLAHFPLAALHELVDTYSVATCPAPEHDPERGRGLALAVARIHDEQRSLPVGPPPEPPLPRFPGLLRVAHATLLLSTRSTSESALSSSRRKHRAPIAPASSLAIPSLTYPSSVSTTNDAGPRARNRAAATIGSEPTVERPSVRSTSSGLRSLSRRFSRFSTSAAFSMPAARGVRPPVGRSCKREAASSTLDVGGSSVRAPSPRKEIRATLSRRW